MNEEIQSWIRQTIAQHPIVVFMKGTEQFPQCGFSGKAVKALKKCGVKKMATVNVMENEAVREGVKQFSNWPTLPQIYINGEFIGGSDIIAEMAASGELQELLAKEDAAS